MAKTKRQKEADEIIRRLRTPPPVIKNEDSGFDLPAEIMRILTARIVEEIDNEIMSEMTQTVRIITSIKE